MIRKLLQEILLSERNISRLEKKGRQVLYDPALAGVEGKG
jgi:hypothetical protein